MVQFLKAKQTSFINKPVGVVGVNTGAKELGTVIANTFDKVARESFALATKEQEEFGKKTARNMKIDIRDSNGNLQFKTIDSTLSDVARASAEPIVTQRYGEALAVDLSNELLKIRRNSATSDEFKTSVKSQMAEYLKEVRKRGGGAYEGIITQDIAKISSQLYNDMSSEEFKEKLQIAAKNKQFLIKQSKNDYIASLSESVVLNSETGETDGVPYGGIEELKNELIESKKIINKLLLDNESNLKENNQNVAIYGAEFRDLKATPALALMKGLLQGKDSNVYRAIRRNILFNEDVSDNLSDYEKEVLKLIKSENQDDKVIALLEKELQVIANDKAVGRAEKVAARNEQNYFEKLIEKKDGSLSIKFADSEATNQMGFTIADNIIANDGIQSQEITNNIAKEIKKILDRRNFKTRTIDGQVVGYDLSESEVNGQLNKFLQNISNKLLRHDGVFKTSSDYENFANYIVNKQEAGLNAEQLKVAKKIEKVFDTAPFGNQSFKENYAEALNGFAIKELKYEQNIAENNKTDAVMINGSTGLYTHTNDGSKRLDIGLNTNYNYFAVNFAEDLTKDENDPARKKADRVLLYLNNGAFPKSFLDLLTLGAGENASAGAVDTALNYFNKFSKIEKGGSSIDKLVGVLDKKTYNILSVASQLVPLYKGKRFAFGLTPDTERGFTTINSSQIMNKIVQAKQQMDINTTVYKSNLNEIAGTDTIKNTKQLLMTSGFNFDATAATELSGIMDIFLTMGVDTRTIKAHFNDIKETMYPDAEGTLVDHRFGGGVLSASKYSLLKTIPNNLYRSKFRIHIGNKLKEIEVPLDATDKPSKFYLNWTPSRDQRAFMANTATGRTQLKEIERLKTDGTAVYLVPDPYGPDFSRVRYLAMFKDKSGAFTPVLNNGIPVAFDLNAVLEQIVPQE